METARIIVQLVAFYAGAGVLVALGFATVGIARAMPHAGPVTWGARILILPAAAALWPWVLARWLGALR